MKEMKFKGEFKIGLQKLYQGQIQNLQRPYQLIKIAIEKDLILVLIGKSLNQQKHQMQKEFQNQNFHLRKG
ncbi:unnamed protein product (macronuclear) [Paramecium tetraurelia]|uniref:Uncharacterized protein n=1 Tax=Paramecium tetraurelia TaxID=5888 RepID=A0DWY7_PARTE|nr:uncharacterized protein GSPATT00039818001 [Paramecium tetraurelia]CAK87554.1 unnamed protein product [Paramecium tetraurelia]|eukprot:XP_001454951.1 hypothetical protein (macronuclear) [Paramecium tetraurelia strain d4-2]